MRILFIDLASHNGCIACVSEERTVALHAADHRISDTELLPEIDAALTSAGWPVEKVTHVACVTGPGGFTSLRVGVAAANAFAHALKIPSAGVHLSDLYHARASDGDLLWLHSTKAHELFVRGFGAHSRQWPEPVCQTTDALAGVLPENCAWAGELIETQRALVEAKHGKESPLESLENILPDFLTKLPYKTELLHPWYGREG